ncbi:WhiB family transcriptional regulator [Streptomyces sp. NPDC001296]
MTVSNRHLPDTTSREGDWRALGACRGHKNPELWYAGGNSVQAQADTREARAICAGCPVLQECRRWALDSREAWGVWGGMTERQRQAVLRRKGMTGRPPAKCGTRSAYQRHVKNKEPIDDACRAANTKATARLRSTGTTKVSV